MSRALCFVYIDLSFLLTQSIPLFLPISLHLYLLFSPPNLLCQSLRQPPTTLPLFTPCKVSLYDWLLGLPLISWLTLIGQMD